jgi:ribonucleoside-diphosphate reductase alpha chain
MKAVVPVEKKEFTSAEKTACSIEAMRNGGECEACQ